MEIANGCSTFELSMPSSPPVQLQLLPLHSPCLPSQYNNHQQQQLLQHPHTCLTSRGIDVNQIPATPECNDIVEPSLTIFSSPFHTDSVYRTGGGSAVRIKREREKFCDSDYERDRTYEVTSRAASDEDETGQPRKKLRLTKEQSALLEDSFKQHSTLNPKQKNALARQLNLRPRQVEVWFQNRRARTKLKQTEVDCELLKRCCESLTEENRRLQTELQELRAIKIASPCVMSRDLYMPLPATTLSMCPSCERLATMDKRSLEGFSKPQLQQFFQPSAAC